MLRFLHKLGTGMTDFVQSLIPATYTGSGDSTDSAILDLGPAGKEWASGIFIVQVGNSADALAAGLYISLILEHSDTDAAGAAVTDDDMVVNAMLDASTGQFALINAPGEDSTFFAIEYKRNHPNAKRYINVKVVRVGNHASGTPMSITGIKYHPESSSSDGLPITK